METVYGILIHDYLMKSTKLGDWFTEKYNALHVIEEMAYNYIYEKNGVIPINKIYNKNDHGRPTGYYMYRNAQKYLDKIKIKNKSLDKGYIYNTARYSTVISFSVIEIQRESEKPKATSFYVAPGNVAYLMGTGEGEDKTRKYKNLFGILMEDVKKYKLSKLDINAEATCSISNGSK